jgi:hypothetical protein
MSNFTVADVINVIAESKSEINLDSFKYTKISKGVEQVGQVSASDKLKLATDIASAKNAVEVKKIVDEASKLAYEKSHLDFKWDSNNQVIKSISYHETRPNISMSFVIDGKVHLPSDSPSNLPKDFGTNIYRNFNIVHDGILNISSMIVKMDDVTYNKLLVNGVVMQIVGKDEYLIDLTSIPISMTSKNDLKANEVAQNAYATMINKSIIKVCKAFLDDVNPVNNSNYIVSQYGDESAEYLSNLGITDKGFSPKTQQKSSGSVIDVKEFLIKFKGISTLPSFNAFMKKMKENKKLNNGDMLLKTVYDECVDKLKKMEKKDFIDWLKNRIDNSEMEIKKYSKWFSEIKFDILICNKWFSEFNGKNDCHIEYNGIDVEFLTKESTIEI